jgi:hypothetical protein
MTGGDIIEIFQLIQLRISVPIPALIQTNLSRRNAAADVLEIRQLIDDRSNAEWQENVPKSGTLSKS